VCGGDDCDDSDDDRFPGHAEVCDGKDNGCTGKVDVDATCENKFLECRSGSCMCKPENQCGGNSCIDTDSFNCGMCGNICGRNGNCKAGVCECFGASRSARAAAST